MRVNAVKKALREGRPSVGTWLSLGSLMAARFMAHTGFDWLTVDIEHSQVNIETAAYMFGAIADAGCVPLARVPCNRHDHIKRVLDNGAMGVVVPMVNSRREAEDAVAACLYPPRGNRSVGGQSHALNYNTTTDEYYKRADDEILVVLQIEHIEAVHRADAICSVPGVDAIFIGPNDLAASMRGSDGSPPTAAATAEAMDHTFAMCQKNKVAAGVHCFSGAEATQRIADGWHFLALNSELKMMLDGAGELLRPIKGAAKETAKY